MGGDEAGRYLGCSDRLREIPDEQIATRGGRMAAPRSSWLTRFVHMWAAAAVVLFVSIGESAAHDKSGETAAQTKKILFLHSFDRNSSRGPHGAGKSAIN